MNNVVLETNSNRNTILRMWLKHSRGRRGLKEDLIDAESEMENTRESVLDMTENQDVHMAAI